MKTGDSLYTGAIVTPAFADQYAALTATIERHRSATGAAPDNLLNGRHNFFDTFARINARPLTPILERT
jgi:hypothetical protein